MMRSVLLACTTLTSLTMSGTALAQATPVAAPAPAGNGNAQDQANAAADTAATPTAAPTKDVVVTGRLDRARESIQPSLGATTYTITNEQIQSLPGGDNQQLNQILLQLPGVVQDGFGQFHVRDDHNNLQFRINGAILPEGLAVFGQTLSPRFVNRFDLRTGALPAQYGLRTAGIIDITTKQGLQNGGLVSLYGGSHGTIEPSLEYGGSSGGTDYFVTGSYRRSDVGIEAVDRRPDPLHDRTNQYQAFGYVDHSYNDRDRISLIAGYSDQDFRIPDPRGLHPSNGYSVGGVTDVASDRLNERQHERTAFAIGSFLHDAGPLTLQASVSGRYSSLRYTPDIVGELLFNGSAQQALKQDFTITGQIEAVYRLTPAHTLRGGVIGSRDRETSRTTTQLFALDDAGNQVGQPFGIVDNGAATEWTYSAYLQDEWKPLKNVVINFGGRFDRYEGFRAEQQFSPRVNIVLTPAEGTTFHAGYARYFSPAPFSNVATPTVAKFVGTSAEAPNGLTAVTPFAERQDYYDVGVQQKLGPVTLGIDGYYRRSHNLIDEGQFGAPIINTPFNYRRGRIDGIEGLASYSKGPLLVYGNVSYSRAKGTDIVSSQFNFDPGDFAYIRNYFIYLDHDQRLTASGGFAYKVRDGALSGSEIGATTLYGSGLRAGGDVPNGGKLPPYAVLNLTASHRFDGPGLSVRFDVINVTDHVYEIRDGSGVGVGAPQFGARRGFFVGVTKAL